MSNEVGRPNIYTDALELEILERISSGESANQIFKDPRMPAQSTFYKWRIERPEFSEKCVQAMADRRAFILDEMVDIADDLTEGRDVTSIDVSVARLQIEARDKKLARMASKKDDEKDANAEMAAALMALAARLPE